ncbi:MAG: hypothetical protein JWQ72_3082 [Polaromonas sp.]|nr:hypothetical protein [Polaromonas sp.]
MSGSRLTPVRSLNTHTLGMTVKTHFSFEIYYTADSRVSDSERENLMRNLGPALQAQLAGKDSAASAVVSDSHKGPANKLVELVTSLQDDELEPLLHQFCDQHGLAWNALE